jgi:tyrosine-protein kinase Etk/Wzc
MTKLVQGQDIKKDIKNLVFHYLSYYKLFALCVVVFLMGAYLYNNTLVPVYENKARMHLVKDRSNYFTTDFSFETVMTGPQFGGISDELSLMNSFPIISKTLSQLGFEITYFKIDTVFPSIPVLNSKVKQIELFQDLPVRVVYDASHYQALYKDFTLTILSDTTYKLSSSPEGGVMYNYIDNNYHNSLDGKMVDVVMPFNQVFENEILKFQIIKTAHFKSWPKGSQISFKFNHPDYLTMAYRGNLSFSQPNPQSYIIDVSVKGTNFQKITVFLNTFIENILQDDLKQKNELALNTLNFIDAQLGNISDSLDIVKSNLQRFRASNKITDLSFQGQRLFDQVAGLENQKATLQVQERYYNYLVDYIEKNESKKELVSPASMNVVDPLLSNMISQLSGLYNQYNNYSESSTSSIYLKDLSIKIRNQENAILENAKNNLNTLSLSVNELNYRLNRLSSQISELPKTELKLFDIEREFKLNDAVLTFLMQKRSEAQIAMASTQPSYNIVEPARLLRSNPVAPKTSLNYIIAFILGIALPFLYIMISDFLDNKIRGKQNIKNIDDHIYLGDVYRNTFDSDLCVYHYPDSAISEAFRAIRTNMGFTLVFNKSRIISITSTSSGEGKSFFSSNLAISYAMSNRRTVLLEFDLRRPRVSKIFGVDNKMGLTSYLSRNAVFDDIIRPTDIPGLDIISAGEFAPNPADLISSGNVGDLLDILKSTYDIIIIDTAPVGVVSESFHLMRQSDMNIFVVRQDYSHKDLVNQTIDGIIKNNLGKFAIVMNDVSGKSISSYKQSNYYKYYKDEQKTGLSKRIKRRLHG